MKDRANGSISSLLDFYKHEKRIFGRCPHCQEPFRLSEVKLTYGKEPPNDLLARMKSDRDRLQDDLDDLQSQIDDLEAEHADALSAVNDKWEAKVDVAVEKRLVTKTKEIRMDAVMRSRACQLGKTIEKIAPMFPGFGHHPCDVRPIFDPIDFVIFDGYFQGEVTEITFVEFKTGESRMNPLQGSIRNAIEKKRINFEMKRLPKETLRLLTSGQPLKLKRLID